MTSSDKHASFLKFSFIVFFPQTYNVLSTNVQEDLEEREKEREREMSILDGLLIE
jgi:hypothetical protein